MLPIRTLVAAAAATVALAPGARKAPAPGPAVAVHPTAAMYPTVVVYKNPTCRCCSNWSTRMRGAGFAVDTITVASDGALDVIKRDHGITARLASCHTAVVGGYVIEGHVPPELVARLLREHPSGVTGLAVPGMPTGSPGMESATPEHYDVLALGKNGSTTVYASR